MIAHLPENNKFFCCFPEWISGQRNHLHTIAKRAIRDTVQKIQFLRVRCHAHGEHAGGQAHHSRPGDGNVGVPQLNGGLAYRLADRSLGVAHLSGQGGRMNGQIPLLCGANLKELDVFVQQGAQLAQPL